MKKVFVTLIASIAITFESYGQALFIENFEYNFGDLLTSNGWSSPTSGGGTGTNNLTINSSGLTYSGSPASGIGLDCIFTTSGQDVVKAFSSSFTNGSVYATFLVKISSAQSTGDYFTGFFSGTVNSPAYTLRVFAKSTTNGYFFGLGKGTGTVSYESTPRNYGETYLIAIKYTFNSSTVDDVVNLWINPILGSSESTPTLSTGAGTTDASSLLGFFIRQGNASNAPAGEIDGMQADASWELVPVTWLNFSATQVHKSNILNWSTAFEQNNSGFNIERSTNGTDFENIGFVKSLSPSGNSSSRLDYSFTDYNPIGLKQYYRLKQTDFDGTSKYSAIVMVIREAPTELTLTKVYPNPSKESIYINAASPSKMNLQFYIVDLNGRIVRRKLVFADIGNNGFDISVAELAPGTYILQAINAQNKIVASEKFIKQ